MQMFVVEKSGGNRALYAAQRHPIARFAERAAQMAESVDALVSNTSGAIRAGSTPALGTKKDAS